MGIKTAGAGGILVVLCAHIVVVSLLANSEGGRAGSGDAARAIGFEHGERLGIGDFTQTLAQLGGHFDGGMAARRTVDRPRRP